MGLLDDIARGVAAVLTGGVSEVAIAAGGVVDTAANVGESVGVTIGVLSDTIKKVGDDVADIIEDVDEELIKAPDDSPGELTKTIMSVNQLLSDFDDLLVVQRVTQRSDAELWPDERLRVSAIESEQQNTWKEIDAQVKSRTDIAGKIKALSLPDIDVFLIKLDGSVGDAQIDALSFDSFEDLGTCYSIFKMYQYPDMSTVEAYLEKISNILCYEQGLRKYATSLYNERRSILFNEPGVIPSTIHNVDDILARFNTVEQPMIEDILDSVDDGVEEAVVIMKQVNKLFVETKLEPVTALCDIDALRRDWLVSKKAALNTMAVKESNLSGKLFTTIAPLTPTLKAGESK